MEYRCRLGTPGGEIIEGVYVADSEARLRREFEEKGLYVLAIQQAGRRALAGVHLPSLPRRRKVPSREGVRDRVGVGQGQVAEQGRGGVGRERLELDDRPDGRRGDSSHHGAQYRRRSPIASTSRPATAPRSP